MTRFSDSTRGNYRHGYKAAYAGDTPEQATAAAKKALEGNPHRDVRTIHEPELLTNGQYRVVVT